MTKLTCEEIDAVLHVYLSIIELYKIKKNFRKRSLEKDKKRIMTFYKVINEKLKITIEEPILD